MTALCKLVDWMRRLLNRRRIIIRDKDELGGAPDGLVLTTEEIQRLRAFRQQAHGVRGGSRGFVPGVFVVLPDEETEELPDHDLGGEG